MKLKIDALWDDKPVDVTTEVNFIWSIANKLRGPYQPDKYKDVIFGDCPPIETQVRVVFGSFLAHCDIMSRHYVTFLSRSGGYGCLGTVFTRWLASARGGRTES